MASSNNPTDKFAFLLAGTINARFEKDLKTVFDTLTGFYGFPANQIWLSHGGALTTPSDFAGAHLKLIASAGDLSGEIAGFSTAASDGDAAYPTTAEKNTGLVYITGDAIAASGDYRITNGGLTVTPDFLAIGNFDLVDASKCELIFILQNSYSANMKDQLIGVPCDGCIICSNPTSDENHSSSGGSYFTNCWCDGLKLVPLPAGAPHVNYYADMLGTAPDDADFLVSINESKQYALEALALLGRPAPLYEFFNSSKSYFLGQPAFLIRDGDNSTVGWWESPDIFLTHQAIAGKVDDYYMPDDTSDVTSPWKNTINVIFRNIGTHPVRKYSIGIQVFRTPLGTSSPTYKLEGVDTGTILNPTRLLPTGLFSNTNQQLVQWDTPFYTGITHECIRAKAQLPDTPVDFTWNVLSGLNEAQRNLDLSIDPPRKGLRAKPGDMFRGIKKHGYSITNPFKESHRFMLVTIPEYQKSLKDADVRWSCRRAGGNWQKMQFETVENGFKGISFILKGSETIELLAEFGFKQGSVRKEIRLPLEIIVDRNEGVNTRIPMASVLEGKFAAVAGLTVIIKNQPSNLYCKVTDRKGTAVPGAKVVMKTTNQLVTETFLSDKNGEVILKSINPDFYRICAFSKAGESAIKTFELPGKKDVKVILEIIPPEKKHERPGKKLSW